MTTLPAFLSPLPNDGLLKPSDHGASSAFKPDTGSSFSDALRKANTDRTSRERSKIDDSRPVRADSRDDHRSLDSDDTSIENVTESSNPPLAKTNDDDRASALDTAPDDAATKGNPETKSTSEAQETSSSAQNVPVQSNHGPLDVTSIINPNDVANKDSSSQSQTGQYRSSNGQLQSPIGLDVTGLPVTIEATNQALTSNDQSQVINNEGVIDNATLKTLDDASHRAMYAIRGEIDTTRQSEAVATTSKPTSGRQPIRVDSNQTTNDESKLQENSLNLVPVADLPENGEQTGTDSKDGQSAPRFMDISDGSKSNPAEGRALQVETALKLEQATGQAMSIDATTKGTDVRATTNGMNGAINTDADLLGSMKLNAEGVDEGRFNSRIMRGLTSMLNQRGGVMNMRLDPAELGELKIQMSLVKGVVNAQFEASNPRAQELLNRNMANLRAALEAQGLTVERLHVQTTLSAQQQGAPEDSNGDQSSHSGQGFEGDEGQDETQSQERENVFASLFSEGETNQSGVRSAPQQGARTA